MSDIKPEVLLGRGARVETGRAREPRRTALPRGLPSGVYGDGVSFQGVSANPSDSESLLVVPALFTQDGGQRGGFWEVSATWCLLLTFPSLFRWGVAY